MHTSYHLSLDQTLHYTTYGNVDIDTFDFTPLKFRKCSIASSLSPEDREIAFNLAVVLEASLCLFFTPFFIVSSWPTKIAENLEESLEYYKKCSAFGMERAQIHIRNVSSIIIHCFV